jgi:hypothetical protein
MTLFISLLILHHTGHFDPLTITGTVILWLAHIIYHN